MPFSSLVRDLEPGIHPSDGIQSPETLTSFAFGAKSLKVTVLLDEISGEIIFLLEKSKLCCAKTDVPIMARTADIRIHFFIINQE